MKIYLSGPMTGLPDYNYPLFNRIAGLLRQDGYEVYNPAEFKYDGPLDEFPIREAFAEYTDYICNHAEIVVVLPGWKKSKGASCEVALAKICGLEVLTLAELQS